ncbi:MAG: HD domain-containing protein [Phycisphaeraceae bacterium]|nr:HD domain-containing protein [Phycisphaeraceae bacterium]
MKRIKISELIPGQTFPRRVFSPSGQKILDPQIALTETHLETLLRSGHTEVLLVADMDELVRENIVSPLPTSRLRVGASVDAGIISNAGQILLEPGQTIEQHHLDAIAASGRVFSALRRDAEERRRWIHMAEALVKDLLHHQASAERRVSCVEHDPWPKPQDASLWPSRDKLSLQREEVVEELRRLYARIEAGLHVPAAEFRSLVDELRQRLAAHPTRFTQLALLCPHKEDYLPDHAYTVAVLGMATARQLRWPIPQVEQVGLTGLLIDLGMLLVPQRIRTSTHALDEVDRSRVLQHPIFTLSLLEMVDGVEPQVRLAALQHHERENGSGYPRSLRRETICDLARVIAVADAFAAATETRSYRLPKLPYMAMEELLQAASNVTVWKPAVRALVQAVGLFPVGSFVRLSDGRVAQVIGSHPSHFDRPVVQPVNKDGAPVDQPVDLASLPNDSLTVVRAILNAAA